MKRALLILMFFLLTACQEAIGPQEPMWEREGCAKCRMVLSEKRYAVQRVLANGEVHFYDDIICALKHKHEGDQGKFYVHPHGTDKWVPAEEVRYQQGLMTPMNSGYGAVSEGGDVSFSEIVEKFKE